MKVDHTLEWKRDPSNNGTPDRTIKFETTLDKNGNWLETRRNDQNTDKSFKMEGDEQRYEALIKQLQIK